MSISGISGGFSANSLIAASRVRARPTVTAPQEIEGAEPPVIELLPPEQLPPPPEELLPPLGPSLAELTPRPRGERPHGLFRNESNRGSDRDGEGRSAQGFGQGPGDEIQDLVNQIVGNPGDDSDNEPDDGSDAREGAPEIGANVQNIVNQIVDRDGPGSDEDDDAPPEPGESPIGGSPEEVAQNLVRGNDSKDEDGEDEDDKESRPDGPRAPGEELSESDQKEVQRLQRRDAEVVAHENAHKAAAGGLANGAIHYDTEKGPDGRSYRVGGHVNINTSKGKTPEETIQRAATIKRAALAPAEPSGQDRAVANKASRMEAEARQELAEQRLEESRQKAEEANENAESNAAGPENKPDLPEVGPQTADKNEPQKPELPRGAQINPGNNEKDEPEVRVAGQEEDEEDQSDLVPGRDSGADELGPAQKRSKEAAKPPTIEDAIEKALDRAGQTPADEKKNQERGPLTSGFQIPAFQVNRAITGYQNMVAGTQNTPAGSLVRLQA